MQVKIFSNFFLLFQIAEKVSNNHIEVSERVCAMELGVDGSH